jgi:hypothetical protein
MHRTSRGTARKNQMYAQATTLSSGLGESRMTASTTPSATPMSIEKMVSRTVPSAIR